MKFFFCFFLPIILSPASTRWSLFYNLYPLVFLSEFIIAFYSIGGPNRNPPNCTILDNRVFEKLVLADESFSNALRISEVCVLVNNDLCG